MSDYGFVLQHQEEVLRTWSQLTSCLLQRRQSAESGPAKLMYVIGSHNGTSRNHTYHIAAGCQLVMTSKAIVDTSAKTNSIARD